MQLDLLPSSLIPAVDHSISRANDSNDKITFNSGNFTLGNNLIVNNGIIVKSSSSSNSGYVSFSEQGFSGVESLATTLDSLSTIASYLEIHPGPCIRNPCHKKFRL